MIGNRAISAPIISARNRQTKRRHLRMGKKCTYADEGEIKRVISNRLIFTLAVPDGSFLLLSLGETRPTRKSAKLKDG